MIVLSIISQKGGGGKSMLARSLAVQGLIDGARTCILDTDPQGTVVRWGKRREAAAPAVLALEGLNIDAALRQLERRGGQVAIVDTPPHSQPIINMAVRAADAALLVTGPNPEDLEQVGVAAAIARGLKRPCGIILNKTMARVTSLTLARAALTSFQLPVCPIAVSQLVVHPYASAEGLTAQEREPESKAASELAAVWSWIKTKLIPSYDQVLVSSHHRRKA